MHELSANALYWVLANGIPTSIGAVLAMAHPLTVPLRLCRLPHHQPHALIGAGYVCAFIQVMAKPPVVKEFEQVSVDIGSVKGWWHNKLLRIFLVFLLTTLGLGRWNLGGRL